MSFYGSIQQMITSIKYNRSLLRGHHTFSKLKERLNTEILKTSKTHNKEVSPEKLAEVKFNIQQNLKREKRRLHIKISITLVIVTLVIFIVGRWFFRVAFDKSVNYQKTKVNKIERLYESNVEKEVLEADMMLRRHNYKAAHLMYKQALQKIPHHFKANCGLVACSAHLCKYEENYCHRAKQEYLQAYAQVMNKTKLNQEITKYCNRFSVPMDFMISE